MDSKLSKKERREQKKLEKEKEAQKSQTVDTVKKFLFPALVIAVLAFGGFKLWAWIQTPTAPTPVATVDLQIGEDDWIKGNVDAPVTLVEFSDFQCPACRAYYPLVRQLEADYPDDLRVVYIHFPLTNVHLNAFNAAVASEAAGAQGKFWEFHNILFERQDEWSVEVNPKDKFISYATELELDVDQFKADMDSADFSAKVNEDADLGNSLNVSATPTFYLNGGKVSVPPQSYDQFKSLIEAAKGQ